MDKLAEAADRIARTFERLLRADAGMAAIRSKLNQEKGGYAEAVRFASFSGTKIGELIRDELLALYPDGKIPEEAAAALIPPSLRRNYDHVIQIATDAQRALNERARTKTDVVHPAFSKPKAQNLALYVSKHPDFRKHASLFPQLTENQSLALVDKTVQMNAALHSRVGLSPKITRRTAGACCKWCSALAGTYRYPKEVPKDVWRRHRACRCVVEYDPGNGSRRQNVHTKDWRKGTTEAREIQNQMLVQAKREKQARLKKAKDEEAPFKGKSVTPEYFGTAKPGDGQFKVDDGCDRGRITNEMQVAKLLHDTLGGDIRVLEERNENNVKTPDYLWRGKYWDLKTTSTEKAVDSAIRSGLKQIMQNPGGLIIDFGKNNINFEIAKETMDQRMKRSCKMDIDIIVIQKNNITEILRYKMTGSLPRQ